MKMAPVVRVPCRANHVAQLKAIQMDGRQPQAARAVRQFARGHPQLQATHTQGNLACTADQAARTLASMDSWRSDHGRNFLATESPTTRGVTFLSF